MVYHSVRQRAKSNMKWHGHVLYALHHNSIKYMYESISVLNHIMDIQDMLFGPLKSRTICNDANKCKYSMYVKNKPCVQDI